MDGERASCIGHNLNLAVWDALSIPEISKIVAKGRKVVAYFHRSPLATGILKDKQNLLLPPEFQGHRLIQDVTRWNSTLDRLIIDGTGPRPSHSFYGTERKESN
jgi:hypothetical protein